MMYYAAYSIVVTRSASNLGAQTGVAAPAEAAGRQITPIASRGASAGRDSMNSTKLSRPQSGLSRRRLLELAAGIGAASVLPLARPAIAQARPLKVGVLLPYTGTFAQLGEAITRAMELYVKQQGGALAGRPVTFVKLDDESEPPKAPELTTKLVQ